MMKVTIGIDYAFRWAPQDPQNYATGGTLTAWWPTQAPQVTPTTPVEYELTARTPDAVTAISSDRRTLSVSWGGDGAPSGFIGTQPEPVWLDLGAYGQVPARISRVLSDDETGHGTLELAEPLPTKIAAAATGSIYWLTLTATIDAGDIPSAPVYPVRWSVVATTTRLGLSVPTEQDRGMLSVVWQPFETGLTDAQLARMAPWTAAARPSGVQSWAGAIESGLERLLAALRPSIQTGKTEDDLNGPQFLRLHGLCAQLAILDDLAARGTPRDGARTQLAADYDAELKLALNRLDYIDITGTGEVTAADVDVSQGWSGLGGSAQTNPNAMNYTIDRQAVPPPPVLRATIFGSR